VTDGRLVAASCTSGWADWIHGELWLLPEGLLRLRTSFRATLGHRTWPTVRPPLPVRSFAPDEPGELARGHRTNVWIRWSEVASADLRRGLTTTRLGLTLADGGTHKLLWLRGEPADAEVGQVLREHELERG
jgi:hypothetical protein